MEDWKESARQRYTVGASITAIAEAVGKSRKTVSAYLNGLPDQQELRKVRQELGTEARKKYKRRWKHLSSPAVDAALIRRQHDIDVLVLSRDRCYEE